VKNAQAILDIKPKGKTSFGRPRNRGRIKWLFKKYVTMLAGFI
jgi:hypothetical protein